MLVLCLQIYYSHCAKDSAYPAYQGKGAVTDAPRTLTSLIYMCAPQPHPHTTHTHHTHTHTHTYTQSLDFILGPLIPLLASLIANKYLLTINTDL